MKHLFVPYEIALKLKEKGFDEPCFGYFIENSPNYVYHDTIHSNVWNNFTGATQPESIDKLKAPLYQQVIDWFREKQIWIVEYPQDGWEVVTYLPERKRGEMGLKLDKAIEEALKLI